MTSHLVNRTSPKGGPFIGTCALCGRKGMTWADAGREDCPNQRGLTNEEAVLEAITGENTDD